nr:hypothetical protein [Burkholderia ubonensis]
MTATIADRIRGRQALARVDVRYFVANGAPARNVAKAVRQPERV